MRFLIETWHRIGARLYLALGFAVFLTLVSAAVGVYYFERSGDINHRLESESVPVLESTWAVAREGERLRALGLRLLVETESGFELARADSTAASLQRIDDALARPLGLPALAADAAAVRDAAYDLADVVDELVVYREAVSSADAEIAGVLAGLEGLASDPASGEVALMLGRMLRSADEAALDLLWDEFARLPAAGLDPSLGNRVYVARGQQLALRSRANELAASFGSASSAVDDSVEVLLMAARAESASTLESSVRSFDEGRVLLAIISVASVAAATLTAWLWVGQGVVQRLSRLSERMRGMAAGDIETPIPEVSQDEIGELAGALEVWRQQALEVQRLNLVERLYGELREANEELQRMQDRLVAQGKLAALGELVSGVAHEMSNPLNFVNNFTEGSLELYGELSEMLEGYRDKMDDADVALLNEISEELTASLRRVQTNGGRAFAIVERMRGLGVVGGDVTPADLNAVLVSSVRGACEVFRANWDDFDIQPVLDLDESLTDVPLVEQDFREAIVNLVSNACYAMWLKDNDRGDGYEPVLAVSSRRAGELVEVRVRDNGTGIADDIVGRIFDPFFSTREGILGAGLGLPIAADVARRMGGDLSVDTVFGEYAELTMVLPARTAEQDE